MWGRPRQAMLPNGETAWVLLLDTEGIGGLEADASYDLRVFSLATSLFVLHDMILTPQTCAALATTVLALAAYSVLKAVTRRSAPSSAGATENEPHDRPRSAAVATWVLLALLVTTRVTPRVSVMPDLSSPDATPCAAPPPHAHRRRHRHFIRRSAGSRL